MIGGIIISQLPVAVLFERMLGVMYRAKRMALDDFDVTVHGKTRSSAIDDT